MYYILWSYHWKCRLCVYYFQNLLQDPGFQKCHQEKKTASKTIVKTKIRPQNTYTHRAANSWFGVLTWPELVLNLYSLKPGLFVTLGDLLGVSDGATIIHDTGFSATHVRKRISLKSLWNEEGKKLRSNQKITVYGSWWQRIGSTEN